MEALFPEFQVFTYSLYFDIGMFTLALFTKTGSSHALNYGAIVVFAT